MSWLPPQRPTAPAADALPERPPARRLFGRALRLRCPLCGGHPVLLSWFTVAPSCPTCGLHLDRDEPGYWIGSYTVNLFVTEGAFALAFVAGLLLTWPAVPWTALLVACVAVVLCVPVLVFPYTKLAYLALDLALRPPEPSDLATPTERGITRPTAPRSR